MSSIYGGSVQTQTFKTQISQDSELKNLAKLSALSAKKHPIISSILPPTSTPSLEISPPSTPIPITRDLLSKINLVNIYCFLGGKIRINPSVNPKLFEFDANQLLENISREYERIKITPHLNILESRFELKTDEYINMQTDETVRTGYIFDKILKTKSLVYNISRYESANCVYDFVKTLNFIIQLIE